MAEFPNRLARTPNAGLRLLRAQAGSWGADKGKIGAAGIGAGANLAAELATPSPRSYSQVDTADVEKTQASFCLLFEPNQLAPPSNPRRLLAALGRERLTNQTAPTWIQAEAAPSANGAVEFQLALMEKQVVSETHAYASQKDVTKRAMRECLRFLQDQKFLPRTSPIPSPLTYKAKQLPPAKLQAEQTLGDARLLQLLQQDCRQVALWPAGIGPGDNKSTVAEVATAKSRGGNALNIRQVTRPSLTVIRPTTPGDGRAVIVCPGGGYNGLAAEHEGVRVCQWFNEQGYIAILLKYRVPRRKNAPKHQAAEQDLQRAMRIVRARAKEWGIDPNRVGVCGFSAGGHLSTMLCTRYDVETYAPFDDVDRLSCRPDFAVLIYPAYLTEPRNSNDLDPAIGKMNQRRTPPLFMAVARNDVFARGMLNFYLAARAQGVASEAHLYAAGGHGGGIDPISYPTSQWTQACRRWLQELRLSEP